MRKPPQRRCSSGDAPLHSPNVPFLYERTCVRAQVVGGGSCTRQALREPTQSGLLGAWIPLGRRFVARTFGIVGVSVVGANRKGSRRRVGFALQGCRRALQSPSPTRGRAPTAARGRPRCSHNFIGPTVSVDFAAGGSPWPRPTTINGFYSTLYSATRSFVGGTSTVPLRTLSRSARTEL